jgi:hypothetical protein
MDLEHMYENVAENKFRLKVTDANKIYIVG